jgi:hypothetical protein
MGAGRDPKRGDTVLLQTRPLPVELQGQIGKRLREVYSELVREPVPDRFVELLQRLKQQEDDEKGEAS